MIKFQCLHCQQTLTVPLDACGKEGRCPECNETVKAPEILGDLAPPPAEEKPLQPGQRVLRVRNVAMGDKSSTVSTTVWQWARRASAAKTPVRKSWRAMCGASNTAAANSMARAVVWPTALATSAASRGAIGKPSLAMGAPKRAVLAAKRRSQQLAISSPAPMQSRK